MSNRFSKTATRLHTAIWWQFLAAVVFWVIVWEGASIAVGNPIVLCGPFDVALALVRNVLALSFWSSIAFSLLRIALGFAVAFVAGSFLGVLAARFDTVRIALGPLVSVIKSAPIVCIIVLLLVWVGAADVPVAAVFLAVFPSIYAAAMEGVLSIDGQMSEMLHAFRAPFLRRARVLYVPTLLPFLKAATTVGIGMSWKAGIAAELIGIPRGSIGAQIYTAKITLETADLLAWTVAVIVLSLICERVVLFLLNVSVAKAGRSSAVGLSRRMREAGPIEGMMLGRASKSYGEKRVLDSVSLAVSPGERVCLMGPSGVGKTTLLRVICGLEGMDSGSLTYSEKRCGYQILGTSLHLHIGAVFQDVRLFEHMSAFDNVALVPSSRGVEDLNVLLEAMLPGEDFSKQVDGYSGGMKRRVELCRALASDCGCVVLDEPFYGLDSATKELVIKVLDAWLDGRTLVMCSHDRSDAESLGARIVYV